MRAQIKAKCVNKYPNDYSSQHGCILMESNSYLEMERYASLVDSIDVTGIPSAADQAAINNAGYLLVAEEVCKVDVGDMPKRYAAKALKSGRLNEAQVAGGVAGTKRESAKAAKKDRKTFCAEVQSNLSNFVADLQD